MWQLQEENRVCVWNNGDGVPVEIHKEEKVYVPELIFGHLLTSSNYNDDEQKVPCIITSVLLATQLELVQQGIKKSMRLCAGHWWQEWLWCQAHQYLFN